MTIKSLQSTSLTNNVFYRSMLAGNEAYFSEFQSDDFLEEVVLTSSATSINFTGLDSYAADYRHLQLRMLVKSNRNASTDEFLIRFNNDSSNSYSKHRIAGRSNSTVTTRVVTSQPEIELEFAAGSGVSSQGFAGGILDILDFSSTNKNTTTKYIGGEVETDKWVGLQSGAYYSTSSVNSIQITWRTGPNFVAGCRFSLYGSKG
jgi:hypothetical protein